MIDNTVECGFNLGFVRDIRECQVTSLTSLEARDVINALTEINKKYLDSPKLYDEVDYQWLIYLEVRFANCSEIQELIQAIKQKIAKSYEDLIYAESYYLYPQANFRVSGVIDYMLGSRHHISGTKLGHHFGIDLKKAVFNENKIN